MTIKLAIDMLTTVHHLLGDLAIAASLLSGGQLAGIVTASSPASVACGNKLCQDDRRGNNDTDHCFPEFGSMCAITSGTFSGKPVASQTRVSGTVLATRRG